MMIGAPRMMAPIIALLSAMVWADWMNQSTK